MGIRAPSRDPPQRRPEIRDCPPGGAGKDESHEARNRERAPAGVAARRGIHQRTAHAGPATRARRGDRQARETLIAEHLPLARALARRYRRGSEPLDDLVQVASLGLIKAVDRFDPERGHSFSTFAQPTIVGELLRHFRDTGWGVHVARGTQELALKVRSAAEAIESETGRAPTPRQLAERTGASLEAVVEALGALSTAPRCRSPRRPAATTTAAPTRRSPTRSAAPTRATTAPRRARCSARRSDACPSASSGSCGCASSRTYAE